ncbi:hypothetical protein [Streptomyces sp. NPDC059743]|uniref:hypothetical protein n=1 Tax=Streptomyces sp. NPDC059743 TaxID=3346928 RepID=UPI003649D2B7
MENRGGAGDRAVAVGVLAGLALCAPSVPDGPDYGPLLIPLGDDGLVDALRASWNMFWTFDPDLTEAARPLHGWLREPGDDDVRGLADYARVLIRAGLLEYCSDAARAESDDILGLMITRMRSYTERQSTGEFFTPPIAADNVGEITLATGLEPGALLLEPCAGTGTMARAAAAAMRVYGMDPGSYRWWLNDLDELNAACCAVNAQLWRLGRQVTVSCADSLREPGVLEESAHARGEKARAEQRRRPVLYPTESRSPYWPY